MLLYGIQGIPYGFQVTFLPILLHTSGASLTKVSLLRALNLPWMLKLLWAPMVTRSASIKQPLTSSLTGLCFVFAAASFMISAQSWLLLSGMLLTFNILVAIQDIAVDTFAIQILSEQELGAGNAVQVVAYKVGAMFGGGVLTWASQFYSWNSLMLCIAIVYMMTTISVYFGLPVPSSQHSKAKKQHTNIGKLFHHSASAEGSNGSVMPDILSSSSAKQNRNSICRTPENINSHSLSHTYNLRSRTGVKEDNDKINRDNQISSTSKRILPSPPNPATVKCFCASEENRSNKEENNLLISSSSSHNQTWTSFYKEEFGAALRVPNTTWLFLYLLIYKLGEQGAVSVLPLYLLDSSVPTGQVAVWTGILAQWISITGSLLGGWLVCGKSKDRSLPVKLTALCCCRFAFMIILSLLIHAVHLGRSISWFTLNILLYLILIVGGAITTATFTLMMMSSQHASEPAIQTLHHTTMATAEVLGKVVFTSFAGFMVDQSGYVAGFYLFAALSVIPLVPLFKLNKVGGVGSKVKR